MANNLPSRRWWLSINSQADGPRTEAFIRANLQAGRLSPMTQVCPEGGTEWRPLSTWPEWQDRTPQETFPPPIRYPPAFNAGGSTLGNHGNDRLVTNPQLPPMANAICIFTIVLLPVYWIIGFVDLIASAGNLPDTDFAAVNLLLELFFFTPASLAITVFLFLGGLRLRCLRLSAVRFLRRTLIADLILIVATCLLAAPLLAVVAANDASGNVDDTPANALDILLGAAGLASLVFEIIALIWLGNHSRKLPLRAP